MSELTDDDHRRRARKRLLSELLLESEWLMQRVPSSEATPIFPTAAPFFGCAPLLYSKSHSATAVHLTDEDAKLSELRQLYTFAGPACILSTFQNASYEKDRRSSTLSNTRDEAATTAAAPRQRIRHQWASLCRVQTLFGDDIDIDADINPQNAVVIERSHPQEEQPDPPFQWVHNPFTNLNPTTTILASARFSPTATTTIRLLGDAAPLSPVVQPYPYFTRRNRRRACPLHSNLERPASGGGTAGGNIVSADVKAYRAAWDREEPLTLPPTCSCSAEALTSRYLQLVKRLVDCISSRLQPAQSAPASPETNLSPSGEGASEPGSETTLLREAEDFLDQQTDCSVCGGLQYFPYSFVEAPLTREATSLLDFCERVPLPPRTEVFCDGPKVTACIICKSPKHEWEVYKALYTVKEHTHAVIYDVCTSHYFPGYKPSKMYWSRNLIRSSPQVQSAAGVSLSPLPEVNSPSATVNSPRSAILAAENAAPSLEEEYMAEPESAVQKAWRNLIPSYTESPLQPPPQCPLNLSRCEPHSLYTPIPTYSLTTPDLRRVYCVTCRVLPADFDPSRYISTAECERLEQSHRNRIHFSEGMELQEQVIKLRRQNILAEHKLTLLRQQAWGYRLSTPDFPVSQPKTPRVQSVVPLRPSTHARRDAPSTSERSSSRDVRRSPSDGRSGSRDHRPTTGPQSQSSNKNRLAAAASGGDSNRRTGGEVAPMPRYPPNAHSSAAASRIHALRAGTTNSQGHGDRR